MRVTVRPCESTHVATRLTGSAHTRLSTRVTAAVVVVVVDGSMVVVVWAQAIVGTDTRLVATKAARNLRILPPAHGRSWARLMDPEGHCLRRCVFTTDTCACMSRSCVAVESVLRYPDPP